LHARYVPKERLVQTSLTGYLRVVPTEQYLTQHFLFMENK